MSHSTRVRGLKLYGAKATGLGTLSHSTRVRALKLTKLKRKLGIELVALYTSAWIEILRTYRVTCRKKVALYTSAWIEITSS